MESGSLDFEARRFSLNLQRGETEFLPGKLTATYGINGSYLGPTLRFRRYERVALQVVNNLEEDTTLHWQHMNSSRSR